MAGRREEIRTISPGDTPDDHKIQALERDSLGFFSAHMDYTSGGPFTLAIKYGNYNDYSKAVTLVTNPIDGLSASTHVQFAVPLCLYVWPVFTGTGVATCKVVAQ